MIITNKDVEYIANLARLYITEEETEQYAKQLSDILGYANQISEIDTSDIEPMTHIADFYNVFRKDVARDSGMQEDILKNAPDRYESSFRVPKIIEE